MAEVSLLNGKFGLVFDPDRESVRCETQWIKHAQNGVLQARSCQPHLTPYPVLSKTLQDRLTEA